MTTLFIEVYDYFLSQIDDPNFIEMDDDDALKYRYLLNSIPHFRNCPKLKDRNENEFFEDLTDMEIMILGGLMVAEYYNPQINTLNLLKQSVSSKDFSMTSQANHLKTLQDLKSSKKQEINSLMVLYSYDNGDLGALK